MPMATKSVKLSTSKPTPQKEETKTLPDETVLVADHTEEVDKLIQTKVDHDAAKKGLEAQRKTFDPLAQQTQLDAEKRGAFATKVIFQGSKARAVFSITNALSRISADSAPVVREQVGPAFDRLFEPSETMSVRPDKLEDLKAAIELSGLDADEFFVTTTTYHPVKDFRRERFTLRGELSESQNEALDEVVGQIQQRPTLTVK